MTISNRIRRIIAAVFLTAVLLVDAIQIGAVANNPLISKAYLLNLKLYKGTPITWPDGTFKGCIAGGSGCWIVTTALGEVTISGEGLHVQ